jgi:hypothetical protein
VLWSVVCVDIDSATAFKLAETPLMYNITLSANRSHSMDTRHAPDTVLRGHYYMHESLQRQHHTSYMRSVEVKIISIEHRLHVLSAWSPL